MSGPSIRRAPCRARSSGSWASSRKSSKRISSTLTREKTIRDHLARLKKTQAIVAGCETDVCVLQSCLGLLELGYEVYVVEDLLFSSARNVEPALVRMRAEGAVLPTYKSLYYEMIAAVEGGRHATKMLAALGPFPDDLPDCAIS